MNKDSIYRIIGYNGEYNANIKRAIRKLLKENHPDNNGDRKIFELINEVKKELEENRVSFDYKNNKSSIKTNEDIDYDYCYKMIDIINNKKNVYTKDLEAKKEELSSCISEYKEFYHDSINLEGYLLTNSQNKDKLKSIKVSCVIVLILAMIVFLISILKKELIFFVFFVLLVVICVIIIHKAFGIMQNLADNNRKKVKKYVGVNSNLRKNQAKQEELKKEIHEINKKITNLENDLRFYNNLLR